MANSKTKIINKLTTLKEGVVSADELQKNIDDLVVTAKDSLGVDDAAAKDFVSGLVGENEGSIDEVNQEVMNDMIKQYGSKEAAEKVYYATANKQGRDPENFEMKENGGEDWESEDRMGRAGINPEVGADRYEEYQRLMQSLVNGEDEDGQIEEGNDPVKLKNDVAKVMAKLDMSSIAPYLQKIDNPTEQAEMIAQFAEKIGVPKAKLSSVVAQLKVVANKGEDRQEQPMEGVKPTMTKNKLIETVTGKKGRSVIKTIKVKDIK